MSDRSHGSEGKREAALVPFLLVMTVVTGMVDAVSYLRLGHVFVANMTGNVVFLGFAIAGAGGISISASLVALASFLLGGIAGGLIASRSTDDQQRQVRLAIGTQTLLLTTALALVSF